MNLLISFELAFVSSRNLYIYQHYNLTIIVKYIWNNQVYVKLNKTIPHTIQKFYEISTTEYNYMTEKLLSYFRFPKN